MPGSDLDELYSSYSSHPNGLADDDIDVDSPVLGLWADEDESRRATSRRTGEWNCSLVCVCCCQPSRGRKWASPLVTVTADAL